MHTMGTESLLSRPPGPNNDEAYVKQYVWRNIIFLSYAHLGALYGLYLCVTVAPVSYISFTLISMYVSAIGVTGGSHRLWAHRAYKAKWPVRLLLCILQTMTFQNDIYEWVRDHRAHHKFSETNADPHNATRGFFFCHMGWLMVRKHPDVIKKGKSIDLSDLEADPIVVWQRRYYVVLMPLLVFVMPTWVGVYFCGVELWTAWYISLMRWVTIVNCTWCVNSVAHLWGPRPYDRNINPAESMFVSAVTAGEGYHNYHHTFPYDYKAAELGNYTLNLTTAFIDVCAYMGWAYDLKTVPREIVNKRINRTGDGSHSLHKEQQTPKRVLPVQA